MSFFPSITDPQAALIEASPIFFVASAASDLSGNPDAEGPVNVSPKGGTQLHIVDRNTVAYLDYPGSGNETARHVKSGGPVTIMIMSTESDNAAIVRLYGKAEVKTIENSGLDLPPAEHLAKKARQVIILSIERTQTSCGYGVPVMEFVGQRKKEQRGRAYRG